MLLTNMSHKRILQKCGGVRGARHSRLLEARARCGPATWRRGRCDLSAVACRQSPMRSGPGGDVGVGVGGVVDVRVVGLSDAWGKTQ